MINKIIDSKGNKIFTIDGIKTVIINKKEVTINTNIKSINLKIVNNIISKYGLPIYVFKHFNDIGVVHKINQKMYFSNKLIKINLNNGNKRFNPSTFYKCRNYNTKIS
jgi:phospholipid N-methyltransferase